PAAGSRDSYDGALGNRGSNGNYWSSTESYSADYAWYLYFDSSNAVTGSGYRTSGFSVRCVAE
ncbi:MAG: hypothetical protein ACKOCO_16330, partial [Bacteroidota bacterium]